MTDFHVIQAYGPDQEKCIEDAIILARVTGSVGATCTRSGEGIEESYAKVERLREPISHSHAKVEVL